MRASKLIEILASHISDPEGGDFEVFLSHNDPNNMALSEHKRVIRCWLYPGLREIIIGDT